MRCTKAIIYKENLRNNYREIKKNLKPTTKICPAVKASGYGSSSLIASQVALEEGASYLAIATVDEAIELRDNGIKAPLLLLSLATPEEAELIVKYEITPLVFDEEYITILNKEAVTQNKMLEVFLAIDSGMGRIGCYKEECQSLSRYIETLEMTQLKGVITHFAVSDSITEDNIAFTHKQLQYFKEAVEAIREIGIDPGIITASSSACAMYIKEAEFDMVRPGITYYGYYADEVTKEFLESKNIHLNLKPCMTFETKVVAIRSFHKGQSVSYGRTWVSKEDTDIAVLPCGYADGLLRRNSPGLKVTINGEAYPIVGRICMDQCMVDIGKNNNKVHRWDRAVILGPKEDSLLDARQIADMTGTIPYEVLTSISKRVERYVV